MKNNELHYSQAVKIGNRVETSGQGGWDDDLQIPELLADEIAQAFRNVERTLAAAGAGWEHVVHCQRKIKQFEKKPMGRSHRPMARIRLSS